MDVAAGRGDRALYCHSRQNIWELRLFFPVGTNGPLYQKENYETQQNGNKRENQQAISIGYSSKLLAASSTRIIRAYVYQITADWLRWIVSLRCDRMGGNSKHSGGCEGYKGTTD
jgi:hypothetical protein